MQRDSGYSYCCNQNCCENKKSERITIDAWAYGCGTICPCGYIKVTKGKDFSLLIKADDGYRIQDIMVDCERITDDHVVIELQDRYVLTFYRVTCKHRVEVYFVKK